MTTLDFRAIDVADVYKGERMAGRLIREGTDVVYRYDAAYLADPMTSPLAWTLPKERGETRVTGESVPPFFAGLLPEGMRLRAVVLGARTSEDDHFTLLLAVGQDAIGDVRVVPSGDTLAEPAPALDVNDYVDVDLAAVFDRIVGPDSLSFDAIAIPGVQPKVSAAMMSSPVHTAQGPAILKLNPNRDYPLLVENEYFFLRMARGCGLRVPDHRLIHDRHGRSGLLVSRFDRTTDVSDRPIRLAQEDSCQVLGVYPARKYRLKTEEVISTLAACCQRGGGSRHVATLHLLQLVAFSYLIGNGDLHGKNFSIREAPDTGWEVTPAYDLVCTQPYLGWRDPMALDLYGRANKIGHAHIVTAAERLGIPARAATRMLHHLCAKGRTWVERLDEIGFDEPTTTRMSELVTRRLAELSPT